MKITKDNLKDPYVKAFLNRMLATMPRVLTCPCVGQDNINATVMLKRRRKGEPEQYIFFWTEEQKASLLAIAKRFTQDPELSFCEQDEWVLQRDVNKDYWKHLKHS